MPVTRRSAVVDAPPPAVWATVADPHQLPRWWPRVERVEGVSGRGFTEVLRSKKGAAVRMDFAIGNRFKPREIAWEQELEGTPFERLVARAQTRITLAPAGDGETSTNVELTLERRMKGVNRLGGFLLARAHRQELDEALAALQALHAER
jgi:uncharacterized protein YndB with AHSA1/START domain